MLQSQIEELFDAPPESYRAEHFELFATFKAGLNSGEIRAAEPDADCATGWRVNPWVKMGILLGFRMGAIVDMSIDARRQPFYDKSTYPVRTLSLNDGVRIVPGGSSIRDGAYVARGVICMPPMFVNVGAYVDEGTMIDSHALVGSCAQIGRNCHLSAAAQIGGVLEPVGALPVIIEDDVMIGGNSGVYEGTVVKKGAVLGTGTLLNRSIPVYDIMRDAVYAANQEQPLIIPENAVVVPGSRAVAVPVGAKWGLSLQCAVIVKYRDDKTGSRIQLEDFLR
ncbi:MAG TPA: 2,3,4,5-tetrahydropyridine-2,6-dicarboxylate N-succinyltransferase [Candidatus Eremiobacteraceae bacterium]|nr:2,3,4,5-tetrahydropyridine-2,6-dicarboxylate N-succinyltransferase [Candidatus Eremiobacteraceae bacterium]